MNRVETKSLFLCIAAVLAGCRADAIEEPAGPEIAEAQEALYGDLNTSSCTLAQRDVLVEAHQAGRQIAMTKEFDACLRYRMMEWYKPCYQGSDDPFANEPRSTQHTKVRNVMRSGNMADVTATCADLTDALGHAQYDGYGDSHERMEIDRGYLDGVAAAGMSDFERAGVAGVIWHEAMHQQDYRHDSCGYPEGEYDQGLHSVPHMANRCMLSAGILGRAIVFTEDDRAQELGIGRHRASFGHLGGVGDNSITRVRLPPASRMRYCIDEGVSGTGGSCATIENPTIEYGAAHSVPAAYRNAISFVEIEPMVLLFSQQDYRGSVSAFGYGEHRANTGSFSGVGNDQTRSIYVPPGARVRVCTDEGGTSGHGVGTCRFYDEPTPTTVLASTSYAEVVRVVTAFTEKDLYGTRASFGAGRWAGAALNAIGDNRIVSLVVPPTLTARVCSDAGSGNTGAGACQSHTRTTFDLGAGLASAVSFLEVTPPQLGTSTLSVVRAAGSGAGRVVSTPLNLDCTSSCSAAFPTRSEVMLLASSTGHDVVFTGCDSVLGNGCFVTMSAAKTVTVNFVRNNSDACYDSCMDLCHEDGRLTPSQCAQSCNAECL
ncbi:hypothetical protein WME97_07830 [Sorangium sp. So ce367]|uniref:hypothetical protein n=1 Tax=Sorangium sp. So ce367 TaxID=3133305 RepID=UPI003F623FD2